MIGAVLLHLATAVKPVLIMLPVWHFINLEIVTIQFDVPAMNPPIK
jgi:hypothetical protein